MGPLGLYRLSGRNGPCGRHFTDFLDSEASGRNIKKDGTTKEQSRRDCKSMKARRRERLCSEVVDQNNRTVLCSRCVKLMRAGWQMVISMQLAGSGPNKRMDELTVDQKNRGDDVQLT